MHLDKCCKPRAKRILFARRAGGLSLPLGRRVRSFPRGAWERTPRRSASPCWRLVRERTRSVRSCGPTQSVGPRLNVGPRSAWAGGGDDFPLPSPLAADGTLLAAPLVIRSVGLRCTPQVQLQELRQQLVVGQLRRPAVGGEDRLVELPVRQVEYAPATSSGTTSRSARL